MRDSLLFCVGFCLFVVLSASLVNNVSQASSGRGDDPAYVVGSPCREGSVNGSMVAEDRG
jgi:hypothetical protein